MYLCFLIDWLFSWSFFRGNFQSVDFSTRYSLEQMPYEVPKQKMVLFSRGKTQPIGRSQKVSHAQSRFRHQRGKQVNLHFHLYIASSSVIMRSFSSYAIIIKLQKKHTISAMQFFNYHFQNDKKITFTILRSSLLNLKLKTAANSSLGFVKFQR